LGEASVAALLTETLWERWGWPCLMGWVSKVTARTPSHEHIIVDNIALRGALLAGLIASL